MVKSLGENIAIYDNKVKDLITHIVKNKEALVNEYKELKRSLLHYDESKKKTLEILLNRKKKELEHIVSLKNKQNEALLKLLEYLNSLEKKDKTLHIRQTLDKMKNLDKEITILNNLIK
jgi:hypothetical protein